MSQLDNRPFRPLGMPAGSVRALLALSIVLLAAQQLMFANGVGLLMSETLMIVLAHYFASRRMVKLSPKTEAELQKQGLIEQEERPLWLPRGAVRTMILVVFALTLGALLMQGRLFDGAVVGTSAILAAYLGGVLWRWIRGGRAREQAPRARLRWLRHLQALAVLLASAVLLLFGLSGVLASLPVWLESVLLALILFYFGAR